LPDYSFIANPTGAQSQSQQFNPLAMAGQYAQLQNAVNQNRLFQANQAAGQLYQQAIDPNTGTLDTNRLMSLASQNPQAALVMPEVAQQASARRAEQLQQAQSINTFMNHGIASLLANDNVGHGDVVKFLATAKANGVLPQQQYDATMQELAAVPPDQIRSWLRQHWVQGMETGHQISFMLGNLQPVNAGGTTYITQTPLGGGPTQVRANIQNTPAPENVNTGSSIVPTSGGRPIAPPITRTVTPEQDATPMRAYDPATQTYYDTTQGAWRTYLQQLDAFRRGQGPQPTPPGNPASGAASGASGGASGPTQPPRQAASAAPPATPPGTPAGPPVGAPETYAASIKNYTDAQANAATYQDRVQPLERALDALKTAKTGEGSEAIQSFASRLQTLSPDFLNRVLNPRTPDEIAAYDEARKYLTKLQLAQPGAARSDVGTQTAGASSPSVHISPQAAQALTLAQLGFERMKQAQYLDFVATHPNADTRGTAFNDYMARSTYQLDPRAFIADQQTPQQRIAILNSMKKGSAAYNNYMRSYMMAKQYQLVQPGQ
jgi:hypothetical protein